MSVPVARACVRIPLTHLISNARFHLRAINNAACVCVLGLGTTTAPELSIFRTSVTHILQHGMEASLRCGGYRSFKVQDILYVHISLAGAVYMALMNITY